MICPSCSHETSNVIDAHPADGGTRRRRQCEHCEHHFTTSEQVQTTLVWIVKRDGRREEFQRQKLLAGMATAARKRPLTTGALEAIVDEIEHRLLAAGQSEIESRVIGEMAITHLKRLDPIAYIRYSSAYRQFVSIDDMIEELQRMEHNPLPPPEQGRLFDDELQGVARNAGARAGGSPAGAQDPLPRVPTPIDRARTAQVGV